MRSWFVSPRYPYSDARLIYTAMDVKLFFLSHSVDIYKLYLCVCVCLSVCPATAYIPITMGQILIKHGENDGSLVRLIVLRFLCAMRKVHNGSNFFHFYVLQSISSRLRHTFFPRIFVSAKRAQTKRARCEREYAAPECDTSDIDLLVIFIFLPLHIKCEGVL